MVLQSTVDHSNTSEKAGARAEQQDWELSSCISTAGLGLQVTCAGDLSERHAEDEAGLVSLSFSLLHHVHRETPALDAVLMQDLDWCLVGVGTLWFLVIMAASIIFIKSEWKPPLLFLQLKWLWQIYLCLIILALLIQSKCLLRETIKLNLNINIKSWLDLFFVWSNTHHREQKVAKSRLTG